MAKKKVAKKKAAKKPARVSDQIAAAAAIGITDRRLRQLEQQDDFWRPEFRTAAGYDVAAIIATRVARGMGAEDDLLAETREAKARQIKEKAEQEEIRTRAMIRDERIRDGQLLDRDEIESYQRESIIVARERLLQIPKEVARLVPKTQRGKVMRAVDARVRQILDKLAGDIDGGP